MIMTMWRDRQACRFFIAAVCHAECMPYTFNIHSVLLVSTTLDFWTRKFQSTVISIGFENSHVIENMLRHTWQLVWLEKGEIYIFFQICYREHTYLGADGVAANQRCSCLRNSRQSAHPIWSDWAVFTSYNGKNPCPLSLVNVKHDGCRCKISSFLLFNYAL